MNVHICCISVIRNSNYAQMTYNFVLSVVLLESLSKPKYVQTSDFLIEGDSKETHGYYLPPQSQAYLKDGVNSHWLKLNTCNKRKVRIGTVRINFQDQYFINSIDTCIGFSDIDLIDILSQPY